MHEMQAVILAAGKSSRMAINGTKLLLDFDGKTIIRRVVEACEVSGISKINLIVGHEADKIMKELGSEYNYIYQPEQIGTGDAIKKYFDSDKEYSGSLFVTVADTPFLNKNFVENFINYYSDAGVNTLVTTAIIEKDIPPYARVIRNNDVIKEILEDFECSSEQKNITEVVTSQYCFNMEDLRPIINSMTPKGKSSNFYLNELINIQILQNKRVEIYPANHLKEVFGINDLNDLDFIRNKN